MEHTTRQTPERERTAGGRLVAGDWDKDPRSRRAACEVRGIWGRASVKGVFRELRGKRTISA